MSAATASDEACFVVPAKPASSTNGPSTESSAYVDGFGPLLEGKEHARLVEMRRRRLHEDLRAVDSLVEGHQQGLNETVNEKVLHFVRGEGEYAHLKASNVTFAFREVPTGLLCTGANVPDHDYFFSGLVAKLRTDQRNHIVVLHSQESSSLSNLIRAINKQLQNQPIDDHEEDEDTAENDQPEAEVHFVPASKNRRRGKLAIFDWDMVRGWYRSLPPASQGPIVIVLQDFHAFNGDTLSDLVTICSENNSLVSLPVVLLFGMTTSPQALHEKLSGSALVRLTTERFDLVPAMTSLDQLIDNLFLRRHSGFRLASRPYHFLMDSFLRHNLSVRQFTCGLKYALVEHYHSNPLSIFTEAMDQASAGPGWEDLKLRLLHDHVELIRRLPSYRAYCESLRGKEPERLRQLLIDDDYVVNIAVPALIAELNLSHRISSMMLDILRLLQAELSLPALRRPDRVLYQLSLDGDIVDTPAVKFMIRALSFLPRPALGSLLGKWQQLFLAQDISRVSVAYQHLTGLIEQLQELDPLNQEQIEDEARLDAVQLESVLAKRKAANDAVKRTATSFKIENPLTVSQNTATLKRTSADALSNVSSAPMSKRRRQTFLEGDIDSEQLNRMDDPDRKAFKTLCLNIRAWLEQLLREHWPRFTSWPLHELLYFNKATVLTKAFSPKPRVTIQWGLAHPEHYLPDLMVSSRTATATPRKRKSTPVKQTQPASLDCVVLYKLYSESGRLINLHDMYLAFESIVHQTSTSASPAELRGRFLRGVAELQWLGLVKPTRHKTDHVMRLTWKSYTLVGIGLFFLLLKILQGHTDQVRCVAFSTNSKLLASASLDKTVRLWNIPSGDLNAELKGHTSIVSSVAFSPDGKSIATGSDDNTVRTWSIVTKQQVKILKGHSSYVNSVAWSSNADLIASGSDDDTVILWDAISGSAKKTLTGHTHWVESVSFSQNGNKLASAGSYDRTVIIWDVNSGAALIKLTQSDTVYSVCFSHDDQFIVIGCADKIVRIFNANTGHEEKQFEDHTGTVWSVACSFDGSMIASGSADNSVRLWDVASTKQVQQLDGHTQTVWSVAFSRDGKFIASASGDKTVRLWSMPLLFQIRHQPKEQEEEEEESRKRQKIDN